MKKKSMSAGNILFLGKIQFLLVCFKLDNKVKVTKSKVTLGPPVTLIMRLKSSKLTGFHNYGQLYIYVSFEKFHAPVQKDILHTPP